MLSLPTFGDSFWPDDNQNVDVLSIASFCIAILATWQPSDFLELADENSPSESMLNISDESTLP